MSCWPSPRNSILCLLPLGATNLAMILGNGADVRNNNARRGARPKRTGIVPRPSNQSRAAASMPAAASASSKSMSQPGVYFVSMPELPPGHLAISSTVASRRFCHSVSTGALPMQATGLNPAALSASRMSAGRVGCVIVTPR